MNVCAAGAGEAEQDLDLVASLELIGALLSAPARLWGAGDSPTANEGTDFRDSNISLLGHEASA